jgi:hypothetical protein
VEYLADEPGEAATAERERAIELHAEVLALAGEAAPPRDGSERSLAFALAATLPLDLDFKQTLLSLDSEAERVRALVEYCEEILPKLQRVVRARKSATGNGHAH